MDTVRYGVEPGSVGVWDLQPVRGGDHLGADGRGGVFDAPHGPHGWLNDHLFVATLERSGDGVQVRVFVVR